MRRVRVYRNRRTPGRPWLMHRRFPGRQTLVFVGNWFIRIHPR